MIPGIDLLEEAFELIGSEDVPFRQFIGREKNLVKQFVNAYGEPFWLEASVQAASQKVYKQYNLDWQKKYVMIYASTEFITIDRDSGGDQFVWDGQVYQMTERNTWFLQDGWCRAMAVAIGEPVFEVLEA